MQHRSSGDVFPSRRALPHQQRGQRRGGRLKRRGRVIAWSVAGVLIAALVFVACWIGIRGLAARSELTSAIPEVRTVATATLAQDFAAAEVALESAQAKTESARALVSDPIWRVAEGVPLLGGNLTVVRELAEIADDVIDEAVAPAIEVATALDPASLVPVDGRIPIDPIVAAADAAQVARDVLVDADARVEALADIEVIDQVDSARNQLSEQITSVLPQVETAASAAAVLPGMLGAEGARTYLIMFMNSAELRALGGTALSFTTLTLDQGAFSIGEPVPAGFGNFSRYAPGEVFPVPDGGAELYPEGAFGSFVPNNTMSPNFPTAAQLTREMWLRDIGTPVDAVIGLDTPALALITRGMEPTTLSTGEVLSADSLVRLLLNEVYVTYDDDPVQQDLVYAEAVASIAGKLTSGQLDFAATIAGLTAAAQERRLMMWSAVPAEQSVFDTLGIDGSPPGITENGAEIGVYVQDNVGSKLNYYLTAQIVAEPLECSADQATYGVTATFGNQVSVAGATTLPDSILGQWRAEGLAPGEQRIFAYIFAPPGGTIDNVTIDGQAAETFGERDDANPATRVRMLIAPEGTSVIRAEVSVPRVHSEDAVTVLTTPMAAPTAVTVGSC